MAIVAGADGCKCGWLLVSLNVESREVTAETVGTASVLFGCLDRLNVLTIDIPIGLTDGPPRLCDLQARRLLGRRGSSVFPAPARQALISADYLHACALSEEACGKRLSKQAYAILPRIRDIDGQVRLLPPDQTQVREVHPEVCFHFWARGHSMTHAKRHRNGFAERLALVDSTYPGSYAAIRSQFRRSKVADDDILDSLAALWTAERIRTGRAVTIPDVPPTDRYGLRMEMVA